MTRIEIIKGRTGCIHLEYNCIPFFKLNEHEWVLMDSGIKNDEQELLECLEKEKVVVHSILTSHSHYDHIGNHKVLKAKFNSNIIMSIVDAGITHDALSMKSVFYSITRNEIENDFGEVMMRPDIILNPEDTYIDIEGYRFRIFQIKGHAECQLAFVTPDGVAYLADSLQSPESIKKNKLTYMLDWTYAFQTLEELKGLSFSYYILSHHGIYQDISYIIELNKALFHAQIAMIKTILEDEMTLENLVKKVHSAIGLRSRLIIKYHVTERTIRSMLEYLIDSHQVNRNVKDGQLVYRTK